MINARNDLGARKRSGNRITMVGIAMAVAALALLATQARSQEVGEFDLHGRVTDAENGQVLVGAWVSFPGSDWGSITDDHGRFRIPDLTPGPLALTVEQLGYETLSWEGEVSANTGALELALRPDPVLLDGLNIMVDRFRTRRMGVATSVLAYDQADLTTTSQETALDFVTMRVGSAPIDCVGRWGNTCLRVRGRLVEPVVFIDEVQVVGGLEYLDSFAPHELYMIEIYGGGRHIRAYTPHYMERAAKLRLSPIALIG